MASHTLTGRRLTPSWTESLGSIAKACILALGIGPFLLSAAQGANSAPAMIVPGQFNVSTTGGFTYTIPIAVPPGTAGMMPALSLDYSSQSGDGLEGLGWTLSGLPSIGRCAQTLAQEGVHGGVNYNANDRFCLEGQRLVAISGTYGASGTIYRTEIDGFSKIESFGTMGTGPSYFKVWTKSGQIMEFGNTGDSKIYPVLAGGGLMTTVRSWAVNKISDTKGNFLTVTYNNDTTNGQTYPAHVDYTGSTATGSSTFASVQFDYQARNDPILFYQAGAVQRTTQLLTGIETRVGSTLINDYRLAYTPATSGAQHDELISVTQCDSLTGGNCLKPTTFGWQGSRDTLTMTSTATGIAQGTAANLGYIYPMELNGDGLTDFLTSNPTSCDAFIGNSSGTFTSGLITANYTQWYGEEGHWFHVPYSGPPCFPRGPTGLKFPDFNGDGFTDFDFTQIIAAGTTEQFILQNTQAGAITQVGTLYALNLGIAGFVGDYNGDGLSDLLAPVGAGTNLLTAFSNGAGTFDTGSSVISLPQSAATYIGDFDGDGCADVLQQGTANNISFLCSPAIASLPVTNFGSASQLVLGDFNGDGKTDLLVAPTSGGATLYLSTGTGFATGIAISSSTDWYKYSIVTGDWNGDGKTDIALIAAGNSGGYTHGTNHSVWLSNGTGFVQKLIIANSNTADTVESAIVADWNNDGASDIWLKKPSGDTEYKFTYVPELISSVTNGLGITTTINYDRINKNGIFYAKCSNGTYSCGDSYPTQDLDGPFYAVSEITSSNGVGGGYSSTYSYVGAKSNLKGRGFSGFAGVLIKDLQTGIVQTTNYATQWPYVGLVTSQTKVCPAPTCSTAITLNSTTNTLENVSLGTSTDGVARVFIGVHQTVVASTDLSGTAFPVTTTTYTYDCDSGSACAGTSPTGFGNATKVVQAVSDGSSKTTTSTYTNDTSNWYLGRLTTANVNSIVGSSNLTRQTSYTYDPASGLLTSEIVEPESSPDPSLKLETDYGYDVFGNKTSVSVKGCVWGSPSSCSSPSLSCTPPTTTNRCTVTAFDSSILHGQFPTTITNALNKSEQWAYATTNNVAFGVPSSHTGPNGLTTYWSYDTFGRKTLETRPDGNRTAIAYTYCTGLPSGESCPTNAQFSVVITPENSLGAQNGAQSITYYDGLSRVIAVDSEGFDASGTGCTISAPCWIRVATIYDANGRVLKTSRPYFLSGGTAIWTSFIYDTIGRVSTATNPKGTTTYSYNGLTITVTNAKSEVTTTVKNAQGLIASVTNADITTYTYDAFGDILTITAPGGNVTTNAYDIRGRKKTSADPDMGTWHYVYDGFGELYSQTDAKSQTTTLTYDALGRVLSRTEPDLTSTWTYDTAAYGIGQIASAATASGYSRVYTYDSEGRPSTVTITVDGSAHVYHTVYNNDGRVSTVDYPSGFTALYTYTTLGYQYQLKDYNAGTVFWTAKTRDAELHLLTQTAGNGVTTTNGFDASTGLITSIQAGVGNSVANQSYSYDVIGNLASRTWLNNAGASVRENACYDSLNRVTRTLVDPGSSCVGAASVNAIYDALGNITQKSDICATANCMVYGGTAGPHALTSIVGTYNGVTNPSFTYDANGNMSAGAGRSVTVTSFNMASSITDGANNATLSYDSEHNRIKQVATGSAAGTTIYLNDPASGVMEETFTASGAPTAILRDYLLADGHMLALRTQTPSTIPPVWNDPSTQWGSFTWTASVPGSTTLLYFTLDHLGSISVVADASGNVVERDSYDAWGKRRNPDGTAASCGSLSSATTRGFTGQEMMDGVCLINFNARIYDPSLGRFMSADPTTETVYNLQILNRYSYVGNNPLSLTDPSGLCFLGCFWKQSWFAAIVAVAIIVVAPYLEFSTFAAFSTALAAGDSIAVGITVGSGILAGAVSAGLTGGNILQGALFGGLSAALSVGIGLPLSSALGNVVSSTAGRVIAQGLVGGLTSVVEGGHFGSGFLAGGVGALAGGLYTGKFDPGALILSAALGGAASELGGGKFANGAITSAFAYVADTCASGGCNTQDAIGGDGAPKWRFTRDQNGNLVYTSDPYGGPFTTDDSDMHVSDPYGAARDDGTTMHGGIDLSTGGKTGIDALSLTGGKVTQIGAAGFGPNSVTIEAPDGTYFTYGHLASANVDVGDTVTPGEDLGEIGTMGNSTGIHVHIQASTGSAWPPNSRMLGVQCTGSAIRGC